jgi:hypothetical protein
MNVDQCTLTREATCQDVSGHNRSILAACKKVRREHRRAASKAVAVLQQTLRISELERKFVRLESDLELVMSVADPADIAAAQWLEKNSPSNETLKKWAARCGSPPAYLDSCHD